MGEHLRKWSGRIWFSQGHTVNQRFRNRDPHLQPPDLLPRQCLLHILLKALFLHDTLVFLSLREANSTQTRVYQTVSCTERWVFSILFCLYLVCCTLWSKTVFAQAEFRSIRSFCFVISCCTCTLYIPVICGGHTGAFSSWRGHLTLRICLGFSRLVQSLHTLIPCSMQGLQVICSAMTGKHTCH